MKFVDILIIITIAILLIFAYFYFTMPSKKEEQQQNLIALFQNVVNRDVDEISIVIYVDRNYSFLKINNKKIIKEFMDALKKDTYIPDYSTGQYNSSYVMTLHSKNNSDLIELSSETFDNNKKSDSVKVSLFDGKNINIFDLYCKSIIESENFSSLFMVYYGYGKYRYENHKLYYVINKYIKGKGLMYNPSTKKWSRK